ncbi:MAG: LptF/LptG family permease [Caldiserica bacterium]|nr:LptF/LptG family permease [Caldisericota bacterium]
MKTLYHNLLRGFLPSFFLGAGIFFFLFVAGNIFPFLRIIGKEGVKVVVLYKIVLLIFIISFPYALSCGFLVGIMGVMGKAKREGALLSLETSGIRKGNALLPFLPLAFLLSLLLLFFSLYTVPMANYKLKILTYSKGKLFLQEGIFLDNFKQHVIFIRKIRGQKIWGVTLYKIREKDGKTLRVISARQGEYFIDVPKKEMQLILYKGWIDEFDPKTGESLRGRFNKYSIGLSINKLSVAPSKSLPDLSITDLEKKMEKARGLELRILKAERERRFSLSFLPFLFCFWGYWVGVKWAERGKWQALGLSLPVIIGIYLAFLLGEAAFMQGFPQVFLWLPYMLTLIMLPFIKPF